MPELPEVETIVRQLSPLLVGKFLTKVEIIDSKVIDPKIGNLSPSKILTIERRGKSIVIKLDNNKSLLVQLRMTGHFHYQNERKERAQADSGGHYEKYLAGIFHLSNGSFFTYNTIRRFAVVKLMNKKQLEAALANLGIEPLQADTKTFVQTLQRYGNSNLKNKLLDQKAIVGIGNIYAQEAMYMASVHPDRRVSEVSPKKLSLLHHHLQEILKLAISRKGTTVQNFSHLNGQGDYQNYLNVYGKAQCPKGHNIKKTIIGGRGTYFCLKCQR